VGSVPQRLDHASETANDKIEFDPAAMQPTDVYKIVAGCIVPRPIGFISTVSSSGINNAAPFSFFNAISHMPPMVCVSISQIYKANRRKDTLTNVLETGEFVVNIVDETIVQAQDFCSGSHPPEFDEIKGAGLTAAASRTVCAPRIEESPVNFECRLVEAIALPESRYTLVIGRVVRMHLRRDLILPSGRIDVAKLCAVGRMTGNTYTRTNSIFSLTHDTFDVLPAKELG
jgi:flavin reductase (DIM6/NTAB) family NADH-FMN oxidoreductase RutF